MPTISRAFDNRRSLGISQQKTLERIDEGRRRQEDRKYSRYQNRPTHREARWTNSSAANRDLGRPSGSYLNKEESERSSEFEENRRRHDDRSLAYRYSTPRETQSQNNHQGISQERIATSRLTQTFHAKEPKTSMIPRGRGVSPIRETNSISQLSPLSVPSLEQRRGSMASRLSDPHSGHVSSDGRVPAKERLSVNTRRTSGSSRMEGEGSPEKEKLKAPVETPPQQRTTPIFTRPSSSTIFDSGRLGPGERSPIRTLSEDRIHVSLRLGPTRPDGDEEEDNAFDLQLQQALSSKAAGKRIADQGQAKKRTIRSPNQGVSVKRRRTTKVQPSPRRKLMMDAITAGGRTQKKKKTTTGPTSKVFPVRARKEKDFRPLPESLP